MPYGNPSGGGGGGGATDHGGLTGLSDDDHSQYHNASRFATAVAALDSDDISEGATNLYFSSAEQTKLSGIAEGATNFGVTFSSDPPTDPGSAGHVHIQGGTLAYQSDGSEYVLKDRLGAAQTNASGTYLVSGAGVAWVSGLQYRVSAATYYVDGVLTTSAEQTVTLGEGDATFDRIDVLVLNGSGTLSVIEGTPAASPAEPTVDPATYLKVGIAIIEATATEATVTTTSVYAENTEWPGTASDASIDPTDTTNPRSGTNLVRGTSVSDGDYIQFVAASPVTLDDATNLVLFLDPVASWPSKKRLRLSFRSGASVLRGTSVNLSHNSYGLDLRTGGAYQQVVIPIADFNLPAGTSLDRLEVMVTGAQGDVAFRLDDVSIQGGIQNVESPSEFTRYRGAWDTGASYARNDLVTRLSTLYVALADNVSITPGTNAAVWEVILADTTGGGSGLSQWLDVTSDEYGAVGDGSTDDTAAIQAAIDAAEAAGGTVYIPASANPYRLASGLTITSGIRLVGDGIEYSILEHEETDAAAISINTTEAVHADSLQLQSTNGSDTSYGTNTSTNAGIKFTLASSENLYSRFTNLRILGFYRGFHLDRASKFNLEGCHVDGGHTGIYHANSTNADHGDSSVAGNTINGQTEYGIHWVSGGGLRIQNNKINKQFAQTSSQATAIYMNATGAGTCCNQIVGNSIENYRVYGVRITAASGITLRNLTIANNEFSSWGVTAGAIPLLIEDGSGTVKDWVVTGNVLMNYGDSALQIGANQGVIDGNMFVGDGVAGSKAIERLSGGADVRIGTNTRYNQAASSDMGAFIGALVKLTADESFAHNTGTAIPFDEIMYDGLSLWSGASPTRFTIPSNKGIRRVRLTATVPFSANTTGVRAVHFRKNGSKFDGGSEMLIPASGTGTTQIPITLSSAVVSATGGDYFEVYAYQSSGSSLSTSISLTACTFGIEIVE